MKIYLCKNNSPYGPFSENEIRDMIKHNEIALSDAAWDEGGEDWVTVSTLLGIKIPPLPQQNARLPSSEKGVNGTNSISSNKKPDLDSGTQVTNCPSPQSYPSLPTPEQRYAIHHTGEVTTKSKGSGTVAIGSIMCIVGLLIAFGGVFNLVFGMIGALLLIVGFFIAAAGRMIG